MESTVVDESLSSMNQKFCSRENQLLQLLQQNEKSTSVYSSVWLEVDKVNFGASQQGVLLFGAMIFLCGKISVSIDKLQK